jgi:hypothetical protein
MGGTAGLGSSAGGEREERELGWGAREEEAGGWGGEGGRGLKKFVWVMKERYEGLQMRE